MNGAAISFTSKRHTTTDDSTTAAELTEAYLASCDVEGFRNLNEEIGLKDKEPTVLYQDNQAAIQIAMNRGSLSKKTRATEIRTLTIRNKIEDFKIVPIYIETTKMLADIGTKALDPKQFINLRDQVCGYSEMKFWLKSVMREKRVAKIFTTIFSVWKTDPIFKIGCHDLLKIKFRFLMTDNYFYVTYGRIS